MLCTKVTILTTSRKKIDSDLNNRNDQWELNFDIDDSNLDIDDSNLRLTPVLRPCSSTHVESSTTTQKPVRIIPGPEGIVQITKLLKQTDMQDGGKGCVMMTQESMKKVVEDVGTISGTIHHKLIDEGGYGKNITVGVVLILVNVSFFSLKPSMHYLNITMRNVVKVFCNDAIFESGSDVCGNVTDQEMTDEEALNLALDEEARQAHAEHEWLEKYQLTEFVDSSRLQDRMKVWFAQKRVEEEAFVGFYSAGRDVVRSLDHMREIVARDSAKLGVFEQLLAGTHVGIGLKDIYLADMEENE
nr:hypothetical protein [Tanacetum cinerariifolium]